jgi:hypothetical protein
MKSRLRRRVVCAPTRLVGSQAERLVAAGARPVVKSVASHRDTRRRLRYQEALRHGATVPSRITPPGFGRCTHAAAGRLSFPPMVQAHCPSSWSAAAIPDAPNTSLRTRLADLLDETDAHVRAALPSWLLAEQSAERVRDHVLALVRGELLRWARDLQPAAATGHPESPPGSANTPPSASNAHVTTGVTTPQLRWRGVVAAHLDTAPVLAVATNATPATAAALSMQSGARDEPTGVAPRPQNGAASATPRPIATPETEAEPQREGDHRDRETTVSEAVDRVFTAEVLTRWSAAAKSAGACSRAPQESPSCPADAASGSAAPPLTGARTSSSRTPDAHTRSSESGSPLRSGTDA